MAEKLLMRSTDQAAQMQGMHEGVLESCAQTREDV
jgi:hypothetical protein